MRKLSCLTFILAAILPGAHGQNAYRPVLHADNAINISLKENEPQGSRFLFGMNWVKGEILTANNELIKNDSIFLTLDKITQRLFYTKDLENFFSIDNKEFKSVTFYRRDTSFVFEHVPYIDKRNLFQVLVKTNNRYSLYKLIHTKFARTGYIDPDPDDKEYNYEGYTDEPQYFLLFPNKTYRSLYALKRKPIERIFALGPDSEKVAAYFSKHKNEKNDEQYLRNLVLYLNNSAALNR